MAEQGFVDHIALGDALAIAHPGSHIVAQVFALTDAGRLGEAHDLAPSPATPITVADRSIIGQIWFALNLGRIAILQGQPRTARRWYAEGVGLARATGFDGPRRLGVAGLAITAGMLGDREAAAAAGDELDGAAAVLVPGLRAGARPGVAGIGRRRRAGGPGRAARRSRAGRRPRQRGRRRPARLRPGPSGRPRRRRTAAPRAGRPVRLGAARRLRRPRRRRSSSRDPGGLEPRPPTRSRRWVPCCSPPRRPTPPPTPGRPSASPAGPRRSPTRAADLLAGVRGRPHAGHHDHRSVVPLSPREREVALLAADGVTSKDIAERLDLSVRTVHNHLQHVYAKLGVTSRPELGRSPGSRTMSSRCSCTAAGRWRRMAGEHPDRRGPDPARSRPMTPEQIRLVQQSATVLLPRSDAWSTAFYDELFRTHPEVRPLFPDDLTLLRAKFTDEIAALLELIGDLTEFEERASRLGADHAGYGVRAAHYRASSTALIAAVDQALGDESTPGGPRGLACRPRPGGRDHDERRPAGPLRLSAPAGQRAKLSEASGQLGASRPISDGSSLRYGRQVRGRRPLPPSPPWPSSPGPHPSTPAGSAVRVARRGCVRLLGGHPRRLHRSRSPAGGSSPGPAGRPRRSSIAAWPTSSTPRTSSGRCSTWTGGRSGHAQGGTTTLRVRQHDGSYRPYDVTGAKVDRRRRGLLRRLRATGRLPAGHRRGAGQAAGRRQPRRSALRPVLDVFSWEINDSSVAIAWYEPGRGHQYVSTGLPPELCGAEDRARPGVGHRPRRGPRGARPRPGAARSPAAPSWPTSSTAAATGSCRWTIRAPASGPWSRSGATAAPAVPTAHATA